MTTTLSLTNRLADLPQLQQQLEDRLREAGFSDDLVHDLLLVSEEIVANIIHHGYAGHPEGERPITVELEITPSRVVQLAFRDQATPFNPLQVEDRDPDDERPGGWGLPMLKTLTDQITYAFEDSQNVLWIARAERDSSA